jgi:hypothetical protein
VAHIYNPSYLGGRDQEDHCSKPAQVHSLRDPISNILNIRKGWLSGSSSESLSSNLSTIKKIKKEKRKRFHHLNTKTLRTKFPAHETLEDKLPPNHSTDENLIALSEKDALLKTGSCNPGFPHD